MDTKLAGILEKQSWTEFTLLSESEKVELKDFVSKWLDNPVNDPEAGNVEEGYFSPPPAITYGYCLLIGNREGGTPLDIFDCQDPVADMRREIAKV